MVSTVFPQNYIQISMAGHDSALPAEIQIKIEIEIEENDSKHAKIDPDLEPGFDDAAPQPVRVAIDHGS